MREEKSQVETWSRVPRLKAGEQKSAAVTKTNSVSKKSNPAVDRRARKMRPGAVRQDAQTERPSGKEITGMGTEILRRIKERSGKMNRMRAALTDTAKISSRKPEI
jgi:hypothetical protein